MLFRLESSRRILAGWAILAYALSLISPFFVKIFLKLLFMDFLL
jgi:hypothetical protein